MSAKRVAVAEARAYLRDIVDDVRDKRERVKITRYGKTLAFIVPAEDIQLLEECQEDREENREEQDGRPAKKAPARRKR